MLAHCTRTRVTLEAYRWGDLPSGSVARTLAVVFLLPFMLVNVAIWMRPANPDSQAMVKSLCRLLALTLTVLYVLAVAGVALDLVGWKCLASPDCLAGRSWLSWLGGRPVGPRLAVLALVPAAAIGLIWRVSCRPGRTFEGFAHPMRTFPRPDSAPSVSGTPSRWWAGCAPSTSRRPSRRWTSPCSWPRREWCLGGHDRADGAHRVILTGCVGCSARRP
ncbi:hypothetical protein NKG94_21215 [Micromonospora sp. M12]